MIILVGLLGFAVGCIVTTLLFRQAIIEAGIRLRAAGLLHSLEQEEEDR